MLFGTTKEQNDSLSSFWYPEINLQGAEEMEIV